MGLGWSFRDGDWQRLRQIIQKIASIQFGPDSVPVFSGLTLTGLTGERLIATDSGSTLISSDLHGWVTGTANQVLVADDTYGGITLSTPQNIHTGASPTFAGLTVGSLSGIVKATAGVLSAATAGTDYQSGTLTATRIPYATGSPGTLTDSANLTFDGSNLTCGGDIRATGGSTTNPSLTFSNDSDTGFWANGSDTLYFIVGGAFRAYLQTGQMAFNDCDFWATRASNTIDPKFKFRRYRTSGGGGDGFAINSGDKLGYITGSGWDGVAAYRESSSILITATGNFSGTSSPTKIEFYTTPSGSVTAVSRMTINADGSVDVTGLSTLTGGLVIPSGTTPSPDVTGALFLDTDDGTNGTLKIYANSGWRTVAVL